LQNVKYSYNIKEEFKMNKLLTIIFTLVFLSVSGVVLAKKGSQAGGKSTSHMSEEGVANTNGAGSTEKVRGQDRAKERRSSSGEEHNKAGKKEKGEGQNERSHSRSDD
jgi:hypothetical protein